MSAIPTIGTSTTTTITAPQQTPTATASSRAPADDVKAQVFALPQDPVGVRNGAVLDRTNAAKVDEDVLTAWFAY